MNDDTVGIRLSPVVVGWVIEQADLLKRTKECFLRNGGDGVGKLFGVADERKYVENGSRVLSHKLKQNAAWSGFDSEPVRILLGLASGVPKRSLEL